MYDLSVRKREQTDMREWLRGGASPCQGEGRGFESRLALSFFTRKSSNHAGFRGFLYSPKVLDLCWTEHLQSRLPIRELPLRCRKYPADAAVLLRDGKQ